MAEAILIDRAGGKLEDSLRGRFLARREAIAAELQEEYAHDKAGAFVAVDEGVILYDTGRVLRGEFYFVSTHPELPWSPIRGIRNTVVHDYFDIAWDVVWDTVQQDLPPLLEQVRALLKSLGGVPSTGRAKP